MKNLILTIAKSLVDKPDEVELNEIHGGETTIFELHVAKDDIGKVIGKHGKTAQAIRVLLNATATKLKKRAVLEIIDEG
ncbi:MAG: KH domain-containing protein [Nitrospinae bacterium]|nr:KH domain-containing protein [Nitrospinota bacterium]